MYRPLDRRDETNTGRVMRLGDGHTPESQSDALRFIQAGRGAVGAARHRNAMHHIWFE